MLLLLAGLNYHSPDVVPYLITIWALIILNAVFRSISTRYIQPTLTALPGAQSTLVTIPGLSRGFIAGQHARIRITRGFGWKGILESHPFTIASADGVAPMELIVKDAGDWTAKLYQAALEGRKLRCSIEGPYGESRP